jgi:hypothetical protein
MNLEQFGDSTTQLILVADIRDSIQFRCRFIQDTQAALIEVIKKAKQLGRKEDAHIFKDKIVVFGPLGTEGGPYVLADGNHRAAACRVTDWLKVWATVYRSENPKRSANLYAIGANDDHGVRRTYEDKVNVAKFLVTNADEFGLRRADGSIDWGGMTENSIRNRLDLSDGCLSRVKGDVEGTRKPGSDDKNDYESDDSKAYGKMLNGYKRLTEARSMFSKIKGMERDGERLEPTLAALFMACNVMSGQLRARGIEVQTPKRPELSSATN